MTATLAYLVRRAWHRAEPAGSHYKNVLLSFPKSGRTWLAYLYAYYAGYVVAGDHGDAFLDKTFSKRCDIYRPLENPALVALVDADPTRRIDLITTLHHFPAVPYFQLEVPVSDVHAQSALLLARDPRDVVVSYFHHTMLRAERARAEGKPRPAGDVDLSEFLRSETFGIRAVVEYMNQVIERAPATFDHFDTIYYEDLVADTASTFARVLQFFGATVERTALEQAIARASFENLQQLEIKRRTGKDAQPIPRDALRFRRGTSGSYHDELTAPDIEYLNRVIKRHLTPALQRYWN